MKNKAQLLQAAQKSAAESLGEVNPLTLHKLKATEFDALGISAEHFVEFSQFFDQARGAYQTLTAHPVKPLDAASV